jgi:DNA-binding SARP family transcriptional activator/serine/threonine protein kinase/WD40 repeat protein
MSRNTETKTSRKVRTSVEFNVLGPVTVVVGPEVLNIGGPKQRTVLAMLIANLGRPVPTDAIVDAVYGDEAPDRGRRRVQTYVSTLRSIVGDVIVKEGRGWTLRVDRSQIDACRFEDLYESVHSGAGATPEASARLLREALALWRGHPYADIESHGVLEAEVAHLNELRVAAQAARIDADLASGRHSDLIGEIEGLIAEHPYLERLRAQHMLALYRAGRQREALRSYEDIRRLLVDELGVDPTPELRDLEQRILEQDESLAISPKRQIQTKAVLVADPGDPIELARLPRSEREKLLSDAAAAMNRVIGGESEGRLLPAGAATYAVFDRVSEAATAAERVMLRTGDSSLRMAIDFGDVEVYDAGVSGAPVSRAAVLVSVAHHGQVLLSAAAQQAVVSESDKAGLGFQSLGKHDLIGLEDPIPVYQLLVGDPPPAFPPLDTDNLPVPLPDGGERSVPGYELRESIGVGSVGMLYRAYQPAVGREVMMEVIGRAEASDADFIRHFEADAQRLALLDHPNINPLVDYWRDTEGAYLVYRYHRGGVLDSGQNATARMLEQVGAALAHAHSYGVVHGSVRPNRIVLDEADNPYLMCFPVGGAPPQTSPDFPQYIAPETLSDGVFGATVDIYALGVLAHEIESGEASDDEAMSPVSPVLARAIAENPADRFESIVGFLDALSPRDDEPGGRFTETRNPYKGLSAFHESDADDFFGRGDVVEELVEALSQTRFLAVVGPSGVGKSSVIRAGLVPAVRSGAIQGSDSWLITDMLPGSHPHLELERAIERIAVDLPADVRDSLAGGDPNALARLQRVLPGDTETLIIIDQFEELFTMAHASVASQFLELLRTAVAMNQARIVVTLRADFLDRPLLYSEFGELLRESMIVLRSPNPSELAEAIAKPSEQVGVRVDPALVERIVSDVHDRPGGLPLLQFALVGLFDSRSSDLITVDSYEEIGGVTGSVARRAEALYETLESDQKSALKQVLLRLVTVIDESAPTRRRVTLAELADLDADPVIDVFARNRMLTFDNDPDTRLPTVEVAHEALLTQWPRLAGWIETTREDLTLSRRLDETIDDWETHDRDDAYLLTGGSLAQHEAWTSSTVLVLSKRQTEYLENSSAHDETIRARSRRRRWWVTAGFGIAAAVATVFGVVAVQQAQEAEAQRLAAETEADRANTEAERADTNATEAEANAEEAELNAQLAAARELAAASTANLERNPELATLLALQALEMAPDADDPPVELVNAIWQAGSSNRLVDVIETGYDGELSLSSDGARLAAVTGPQTISMFDTQTHEVLWEYSEETADSFVYPIIGPDERTSLAIYDSAAEWLGPVDEPDDLPNRVVILTPDGEVEATLEFPECNTVGNADWSPDGRYLAVGYDIDHCFRKEAQQWIEVFDSATWQSAAFLPIEGDFPNAPSPRFDANGRLYALRGYETNVVFEANTFDLIEISDASGIGDVSPDGARMYGFYTANGGGTAFSVLSFDTETGALADILYTGIRYPNAPFGVTATDDGKYVIVAVGGATTHIYDPLTGEERFRLPTGSVETVGYDAEHQLLYTAGSDEGPRVWDLGASSVGVTATGDLGDHPFVNGNSFSIGSNVGAFAQVEIATSSWQTGIFDLNTGEVVDSVPGSEPMATLANGRLLLRIIEESAEALAIYDPASGELNRFFECENLGEQGCTEPGSNMVVSVDGDELLAYPYTPDETLAGEVHTIDPETGEILRTEPIPEDELVRDTMTDTWVLGSPTTRIDYRVVDRESGELLWQDEMGHSRYEVSRDGRWLLTREDEAVQLIDTATWNVRFTVEGFNNIRGTAFNEAGTLIAVADVDSMRIIDIETGLIAQQVQIPGVSDIYFIDDETVVVGTNSGIFGTVSLSTDELVARTRASLRRSLTDRECDLYSIEPCPTLEETRGG